MLKCYKCECDIKVDNNINIHRSETCEKCYTDIRVCKMCTFHDVSSYNECREPSANRITDKEKANFCDFFRVSGGQSSEKDAKQKALDAANALFGNKE
jgi:hypothetical protein